MNYNSIDSEFIGNCPNAYAGSTPYIPTGCCKIIPAVKPNSSEKSMKNTESSTWLHMKATAEKCFKPYSVLNCTNFLFKRPRERIISPTCSHVKQKKKLSTQTVDCLKQSKPTSVPDSRCIQTTASILESCVQQPKKIFLLVPTFRKKEKVCVKHSGCGSICRSYDCMKDELISIERWSNSYEDGKKMKNKKTKKQPVDDGLNMSWCPRGIICVCPDPCEGRLIAHDGMCKRSCVRINEALGDRCVLRCSAAAHDKPVATAVSEIQRTTSVRPHHEDKRYLKNNKVDGCFCVTKSFDNTVLNNSSQEDFNIQTDLKIGNIYEKLERNTHSILSKGTQATELDLNMRLSKNMEEYKNVFQSKNEVIYCKSCHCSSLEVKDCSVKGNDERYEKECQSPLSLTSVYTIPEGCENVADMENRQSESLDLLRPPVKRGYGSYSRGANVNVGSRSNGYTGFRDCKNISAETQYPPERVIRGSESSSSLILKTAAEKQYAVLSYTNLLFDRTRKISPTCASLRAKVQPCLPKPTCQPKQTCQPKPTCQLKPCSPWRAPCQKATCQKATQTDDTECSAKKHKQSCKRVQKTVCCQESCHVPSKEVFLVVPSCKKDKVFQLKKTGSACTFPKSYNCLKDEVIPIDQLCNLNTVLDTLNMNNKKEKNKKKKKNEDVYPFHWCSNLSKDKARCKDAVCVCPDVPCSGMKLREQDVECRKSYVRITGRLGLGQDDRYVLRCAATVNDKPVATEFTEIQRPPPVTPHNEDKRYLKRCEVDSCTCLTNCFNTTVSNNIRQKTDFNIQTDLENENKYGKPEKHTRSMLSKETQAADVDFNVGISTDIEKYKNALQFKNEVVQFHCSNVEDKSPPERDHDDNSKIECQNPLVVISVYPMPDCCENVAVIENHQTGTMTYSPRKPLLNQNVKQHPNSQTIKEKKNESKTVKPVSRSPSPSPNRNQNKNNKLIENKGSRIRKISPERDTPIAMHSRQAQKVKDTNVYRLSFKDRIRDKSPPKTPPNRKNNQGTNTDHNITKKKIVDNYTQQLAAYMNNPKVDTQFRYPEMGNSRITLNIDGDKERYDLRFQKEKQTTEMKVKKTVKDAHNKKPGEFLGIFPPMNNFITPDEPRKRAQAVHRSEQLNDAPPKTFARLQVRDSIEISHRHDVNAGKTVKKITNDSDDSSEAFSAPIKHYRGDNCPIADPIKRDKEIRTLLGIDKGVASLVKLKKLYPEYSDVKVEKKKYAVPVRYYFNRTCEKKILTGINLMEVPPPCVCCDIRKNFLSTSSCSCSKRRRVQPHRQQPSRYGEPSQPYGEVPQYGEAQQYGENRSSEEQPYGRTQPYERTPSNHREQQYEGAQPYGENRSSEEQPYGRTQPYERTQSNHREQQYGGAQPFARTEPYERTQSNHREQQYGGAHPFERTHSYRDEQPYGEAQQSDPQSIEEPGQQRMLSHNTIIRKPSAVPSKAYRAVQDGPQEDSSEESPSPGENNFPGKSTGTQYDEEVQRTSLYQQLILNRNIQVFLQVEQFSKQKPIILSRKQYDKVKRTIESTLTNKSGRDYRRKNCICKTSLVSVGDVRRKSKVVPTSYFHRQNQTDNRDSGIVGKISSLSNKSVRINEERVPSRTQSKRAMVLYSKETTVDPLAAGNAMAPVTMKQAVSSVELRYSPTSVLKQVTFSSTNVEVGSTTAALQQELLSIHTLFKGRRVSSERRKCHSPNLGTSVYSLCSDEVKPRTPPPGAPEPKKKPFLRRLMSCLVMRSTRASELNNVLSPPVKIPSVLSTSIDSYHISTSLGEIEVTSSIYDTSASFYTNHSIYPINSKMKRGGFFNSVREFLSNRKS